MSINVTIDEAQAKLRELIAHLNPGDEVVITENQQAVARIVGEHPPGRKPRTPGNCRDMITLLIEDNEHLQDFTEYMP